MKSYPPEIVGDELYAEIQRIAALPEVTSAIEIGSGTGKGSTQAIIAGLKDKTDKRLACLETRRERYEELFKVACAYDWIKPIRASSVPLIDWMTIGQVMQFYRTTTTNTNRHPLEVVLRWLHEEIDVVLNEDLADDGVKQAYEWCKGCAWPGLCVLDGGPFCGAADAKEVFGSTWIVLDDVNDIKNYHARASLLEDRTYRLHRENLGLRNGYSIFRRV